jgi:hypothetical protein
MMNPMNMADVAANTRDRYRTGAVPSCLGEAVSGSRALAMAAACPQVSTAAVHYSSGPIAAGRAALAQQQRSSLKYAHMTRIAREFGGALGPHPARDPV